jgi:regulatory protein spx
MLKFYCFPTWTTCRKAKAWLSEQQADYEYRDILKEPLAGDELAELAARGGITVKELLNPKSTGFKELKLVLDKIDDLEAARLIQEYPKIMRRPLLSDGKKLAVGFDPDQFAALLK